MRWTTERHLQDWQERGLLNPEKAAELRADLDRGRSHRGIRIFAVIGAVLVGLGVILFVSSNWASMGPVLRVAVLMGAFAAVVTGALIASRRGQPRVTEALWLLATLVMGANIFLIAQIFNHELTYWRGTMRWMLGALVLGWALRSRLQAAVAIPLALLTLGWIDSGSGWWVGGQFEFLASDGGLRPILPLIGVGLLSLSLLVERRKSWDFLSSSAFAWGMILIVVPAILTTAERGAARWFFSLDGTVKQWAILATVGVLLGAAVTYGRFRRSASRFLLGGTALLFAAALIRIDGEPWMAAEMLGSRLLFVVYVLAVFALTLLSIWTGVRARNPALVNFGMVTCALLILTQYFSWSFAMLDRSVVFILGGLVVLGLAIGMEKKRRALLGDIDRIGGLE